MFKCVICQGIYSGFGHNAEPYREGTCCTYCNEARVLPKRIAAFFGIPTTEDKVYKHTFTFNDFIVAELSLDAETLLSVVNDQMGYIDAEVKTTDDPNTFEVIVTVFDEEYDESRFKNDVEYYVSQTLGEQ